MSNSLGNFYAALRSRKVILTVIGLLACQGAAYAMQGGPGALILLTAFAAIGALAALVGSADLVIDNAETLGLRIGISPLLVGIVAGIITSFPELFVSLAAALKGEPSIGLGNIVGSNIANLMLILGGSAAAAGISGAALKWQFNGLVMAIVTTVFMAALMSGFLNWMVGLVFLAGTAAYIFYSYHRDRAHLSELSTAAISEEHAEPVWVMVVMALIGVGVLILSAGWLVDYASKLALHSGISPAFVALVGVSVGTSLPELMVSLKAAFRGNPGMAVGNVFGSNIFNILMVGGSMALFSHGVPGEFGLGSASGILNMVALGGASAYALIALYTHNGFSKREGYGALMLYIAYCAASFTLNT